MNKKKQLPPLKRFGQNFLKDNNILEKIINFSELDSEDAVLEIGMGQGVLTKALAKKVKKLYSFEIDHGLFQQISPEIKSLFNNVELIEGDYLKLATDFWPKIKTKLKVIANIPYNITTPILENIIANKDKVSLIILMVQKEVAERLQASPDNKSYGSLSIYAQYHMEVEMLTEVSRNCFYPIPKVDSALIKLKPWAKPQVQVSAEDKFFKIVRSAFWGRRKTLRNTLKQSPYTHYTNEMLRAIQEKTGIDLQRRGETLSLQEFAEITNSLFPNV